MSDWNETAQVAAECLTAQARMPKVTAEYVEPILVEMALLQRKLLLSDDAVERAARGIHASHDRGWHFDAEDDMQEWLNEMAEAEFDNSTGWRKTGGDEK